MKKKVLIVSLIQELPMQDAMKLKEQLGETFPGYEIRLIVGALNVTPIEVEVDDPLQGQYL